MILVIFIIFERIFSEFLYLVREIYIKILNSVICAEMPEWSKGVASRPTASLRAGSNPALGKHVGSGCPSGLRGWT